MFSVRFSFQFYGSNHYLFHLVIIVGVSGMVLIPSSRPVRVHKTSPVLVEIGSINHLSLNSLENKVSGKQEKTEVMLIFSSLWLILFYFLH